MASVSSSASPAAVPLRVSVRQGATVIRPSVALMLLPSDTMLDALRRALEFADTRKPCEAKIEELCAGAVDVQCTSRDGSDPISVLLDCTVATAMTFAPIREIRFDVVTPTVR